MTEQNQNQQQKQEPQSSPSNQPKSEDRFHRQISGQEKMELVLKVLKKELTVQEVCHQMNITKEGFYKWFRTGLKSMKNFYEFLFPNVCWSWDAMDIRVGIDWLKLQVLRDESSRYILNWLLTAETTVEQVKRLLTESMEKYCTTPLVLKRDNELPLNSDGFGQFLKNRE
ncbi:MAG: hypothetical protein AB1349_10850 [Elusimicrobiota bacterium]